MNQLTRKSLYNYLSLIYKKHNSRELNKLCAEIKKIFPPNSKKKKNILWDEKDCFLITYADSIKKSQENNFSTLRLFLNKYCKDFSYIHVLPFYPYSSDDGFAVIDYEKIQSDHGNWKDFCKLSKNFKIMSDLVINHCSSKNQLFQNFLNKLDPGSEFFISSTKNFNNFSKVVRPRSSKLSKKS